MQELQGSPVPTLASENAADVHCRSRNPQDSQPISMVHLAPRLGDQAA